MSQRTPYVKGSLASKLRFTLEVNDTKTVLNQTSIGGQLCWAGRPFSETHAVTCPVALIIGADGTIPYGPALNFIVDGGRPRSGPQRQRDKLEETRKLLLLGWQFHVSQVCTDSVRAEDSDSIGRELGEWLSARGFTVMEGPATAEDREFYALLGVSQEIVNLADHHGWALVPNFRELVAVRVPQNFATLVEGEWDAISATIAVTNQLDAGEVAALVRKGYRFARCGERRVG